MQGTIVTSATNYKNQENFGDRSFQVAAPGLWNTSRLPSEIRAVRSHNLFKGAVKTYLFKKAFACYC